MNHNELKHLVEDLVSPAFAPYMFTWVERGDAPPSFVSLIPQDDGTIIATYGDQRTKAEPVLDDSGARVVFSDEDRACRWAWAEIKEARTPPSASTEPQQRRAEKSATQQDERMRALEHGEPGEQLRRP
ncbi:hypothetical protein CW368_00955 [Actinomycetales bacterium SN12]|nr:hypothetical protein CW368_00955 [Actinomycetales bacterium SN12]